MFPFIYLLLPLPLIFFLYLSQKLKKASNNAPLPPGPSGLPWIGNLLQLDSAAPHRHLWRLSQTYGPLTSLRLGCRRVVAVSTAKMAEEVMKTHDLTFCSRPSFTGTRMLTYDCADLAVAPYGAYWREMKKICVVHLFNSNRVRSFCPVREFEVSKMVDEVPTSGETFDLSEAMMSLTSTIICQVAFGKKFEGIKKSKFKPLMDETQAMYTNFFFSDYFPILGFVDRISGLIGRLEKNFEEFDVFYQEIIDEHLDPGRVSPEREDILDVLLQIQKDRSFSVQLTLDQIKAILMDVFIGGTDTSATTVIWAMTYLMKNPIVMEKAQREIRLVVGKKGFVREDDIQQLTYLKAVIKEAMRLQPALPLVVPRESMQRCNLGGYEIPAKTIVYVNIWAIGRDPEAWGENPEEFKPERFIGKSIDVKGTDFQLLPFGAGRRMCPGIHMGLATIELSLANLLYRFDWEMPAGMKPEDLDMDVLPGITMYKKNALRLVAKKHV